MPRRPWRSLNSFSASPIRVPLDQSGAVAAARWIARSGLRDRERAGQAGEPRGEHECLGVARAAGGAGQELEVGARVGLHRARDVAQQDHAAARHAAAAACEPDRVAGGVRCCRAASGACRSARRGGRARSGASAGSGWPSRAAPSAGRAWRALRATARRSASSAAPPRRWPPRAPRRRAAPRRRRHPAARRCGRPSPAMPALVAAAARGLARARVGRLLVVRLELSARRLARAEHLGEHRVEGLQPARGP